MLLKKKSEGGFGWLIHGEAQQRNISEDYGGLRLSGCIRGVLDRCYMEHTLMHQTLNYSIICL